MELKKKICCIMGCFLMLFFGLIDEIECSAAPTYAATLIGMKDADGYDRQEGWFNDGDFNNSLALLVRTYPASQKNYISNCSATVGLDYMKKSCVFMIHSHGNSTEVKFTNSNGSVSWLTTNRIENLSTTALVNCQLIVYGTCSAGQGGSTAANIVNRTYEKYARHVVGFQGTTYVAQVNDFFHQFMHELGTEKETLGDAYDDALFWVKVWNLGSAGGIDKVLIRGNENHYLTEYKIYGYK